MKIIIESQGDRVEVTQRITSIKDVISLIKRALIGVGFHPDNIKTAFGDASKDEG